MSTCDKLLGRLKQLLKKFSLQEFSILLDKSILNIPLSKIGEAVSQFMLSPTASSVAEVCIYFIKRGNVNEQILESLIRKVYAWDVVLHKSQHVKWCAVRMEQEVGELPETFQDLSNTITQAYTQSDAKLSVNVLSLYHNHIVWTVIFPKMKLKNGRLKDLAPVLFAYKPTLEPPHFLYSPQKLDEAEFHFSLYMGALGYDGHQILEYQGIDPVAMFDCIETKYQHLHHLPVALPPINQNAIVKIRSEDIFDYSRAEERRVYADQIFTSKTRQYFKVECDGTLVDETKNISNRGSEVMNFHSTLELRAHGNKTVEDMLHYLVSIGAVTTPVPDYMLHISSTPSNTITIDKQTHLSPQ